MRRIWIWIAFGVVATIVRPTVTVTESTERRRTRRSGDDDVKRDERECENGSGSESVISIDAMSCVRLIGIEFVACGVRRMIATGGVGLASRGDSVLSVARQIALAMA